MDYSKLKPKPIKEKAFLFTKGKITYIFQWSDYQQYYVVHGSDGLGLEYRVNLCARSKKQAIADLIECYL